MSQQTKTLRALLGGAPFIAADCNCALTARIVQHVGFPAGYMGGHSTGMLHHAVPDSGTFTPTEMIEQAARVCEAVTIPIVADADQVGESVVDVYRSIKRYEAAGVAAVHMEDEVTPKHSTFAGPIMSVVDMSARIEAAANARTDADFLIIARTDEFYVEGGGGSGSLDGAIERGKAYAAAGADVFLPTMATADQVAAIAAEVPIPIAVYGPLVPKVQFSLFTGFATASAAREHMRWARHLLEHGEVPADAYDFPDKVAIIRQGEYDAVVTTWANRTGRQTR